MALLDLEQPTPAALRWYGLSLASLVAIVGVLVWTRGNSLVLACAIWAAAGLLLALYYAVPALRRPIVRAWMIISYPLAFVVSHVVMAAIYFLVLTPIGLLRRALAGDPMQRGFDERADSYWQPRRAREPGSDKYAGYFRQF